MPEEVAGRRDPCEQEEAPAKQDIYGTAEESAEKVELRPGKIPSGAKAHCKQDPTAGLKSRPFKTTNFSAACEAVPFQNDGSDFFPQPCEGYFVTGEG
jgi:hypothetical protein